MRVSIVTITYNSESTLGETLESVASQTYDNIEHVIVDGISGDNTLNIARAFPHVSKIVSEKDNGIYDAMNKGISLCTGEIICILNSDDLYVDNEVISLIADQFKDPSVEAVYGDLEYVDAENINKVIRTWRSGNFKDKAFLYGWMPPHPSFFVRRSVYEKAGLYNTELRTSADYEFMLRVVMKYRIKLQYIPRLMVKMRTGGVSNSSLRNRLRANQEDRMAWELNGLKPYFFTLYLKPVRKIFQYLIK